MAHKLDPRHPLDPGLAPLDESRRVDDVLISIEEAFLARCEFRAA